MAAARDFVDEDWQVRNVAVPKQNVRINGSYSGVDCPDADLGSVRTEEVKSLIFDPCTWHVAENHIAYLNFYIHTNLLHL